MCVPSPLEEPIEALDGSMKVGWQNLSFLGHPENHRKGSALEFAFNPTRICSVSGSRDRVSPPARTGLRLQSFNPVSTVSIFFEPLEHRGSSKGRAAGKGNLPGRGGNLSMQGLLLALILLGP
jgi:hypothetical protein